MSFAAYVLVLWLGGWLARVTHVITHAEQRDMHGLGRPPGKLQNALAVLFGAALWPLGFLAILIERPAKRLLERQGRLVHVRCVVCQNRSVAFTDVDDWCLPPPGWYFSRDFEFACGRECARHMRHHVIRGDTLQ